MFGIEGRALRPSLFIFGSALLLIAGAAFPGRWYAWGAIALLAFSWSPWRSYPLNALGLGVGAYCGWLLWGAMVTPVYSPESIYEPVVLMSAFAAAAAMDEAGRGRLFRWGAMLVAGIVAFGLAQHLLGLGQGSTAGARATASFVTPNTLGTVINMVLAPLAAIYLLRGGRWLLVAVLWFFAGLVATQSRGAMLAYCVSMGFVAVLLGTPHLRSAWRRYLALAAGSAGTWVLVVVLARKAVATATSGMNGAPVDGPSAATWVGRATWDRLDLYSAALQLILERPVMGAGANMFYPLFEPIKPPSLQGAYYFFVHNDYLQVWLEFGLPGLMLLVLVAAVALIYALRDARRAHADPVPLACGAAAAACFAHAMVDFPLYIPSILLLLGLYLGTLAGRATAERPQGAATTGRRWDALFTPLIRGAIAVFCLAWLSQPVVAEILGDRSTSLLARGDASNALYWRGVAQRFEPRESLHYWAEGVIWRDQAELTRNPLFAAKAEALFEQAARVNPYDPMVLLARATLHRRLPELLQRPAAPAEIAGWTARAVALRPSLAVAQFEHLRSLIAAGRIPEARAQAKWLSGKYPKSENVRRLAAEL